MEGAFSVGIYDAGGKLIRTLHHDADTSEFGIALNGLITYWDGKDDAGTQSPAGKYSARGWCVGDDVDIEGEAFLCNEWITDETSPRIRRITDLWSMPDGGFGIGAETSGGATMLNFDTNGNPSRARGGQHNLLVRDGKIIRGDSQTEIPIKGLEKPISAALARDGGIWVIDGGDVKEFSPSGEFQRRLGTPPNEPAPMKIAASQTTDAIFLLEQNDKLQRLRELILTSGTAPAPAEQATSLWKVALNKTITFSDTLDAIREKLKMPDGKPFSPEEKVKLALAKNPLEQKKAGEIEVSVAFDHDGSFLKSTDDLPLKRLSDTPHLKWAALARGADADSLVLFQSDGAVVEEFTISKLSRMMAFDCGEFDYDPARDK